MWLMRSWLQEYFLPYTCTLLHLVTSHLLSWGHHVIAWFVCRREDWNFLSATWPGALDFPYINLTLQWRYTSFVHYHGHRRWHNRGSWDRFTGIALGSLRALIASKSRRPLIPLRTSRSLWSLGPSWPMFAWGTWPASSSPDSLGTMCHAGQVTHHQFNFPFYVLSTNDLTFVWFLVYIVGVAFVTNLYFCNWGIIYVTLMISQWKNVLVDSITPCNNWN